MIRARNLGQFQATLAKWPTLVAQRLDDVVREVTFVCAENMIVGGHYAPGTPVDTGFARASWWIRINERDATSPLFADAGTGTVTLLGPGGAMVGQARVAEAGLALLGAKAGDRIYVLNGAHYINELEFGSSRQAPEGFVRLTLRAGQQIVDQVAQRILNEL